MYKDCIYMYKYILIKPQFINFPEKYSYVNCSTRLSFYRLFAVVLVSLCRPASRNSSVASGTLVMPGYQFGAY